MLKHQETIAALSTPPGQGAIGVIRLSGPDAMTIADDLFKGRKLAAQASHTLHFGRITDTAGNVVDEAVAALFKGPHSYTGEDVVEFSCHGSPYILQQVLQLCLEAGARAAQPGEFTQRAFLNGRLDLTQAEAVADLIASESEAAHQSAMHQLRGGFSRQLKEMREQLINFAALIELELDFGEEDVEFADRTQLYQLLGEIHLATQQLIDSFRLGNAVRNGVAVAIIGAPNAGKSTLLNALLNEERAIVSNIAGTTRDTVEETMHLGGILFRFIDTAGIRAHTDDLIEQQGIARSRQKAAQADVVIVLLDGEALAAADADINAIADFAAGARQRLLVINKTDLLPDPAALQAVHPEALLISAQSGRGLPVLKERLISLVTGGEAGISAGQTIITNTRHLEVLRQIQKAVASIKEGMDQQLSGDLLSHHIRQALFYIGALTGEVQVDRDILGTIFGKFCIGK